MKSRSLVLSVLVPIVAVLGFDSRTAGAAKPAGSTSASPSVSASASALIKGGGLGFVTPGKCPPGMASIPGGSFSLAGDVKVVAPFCLDRTEVTVAAYSMCSASGGCLPAWKSCVYPLWTDKQLEGCADTCNTGKTDRLDHPVNCVDWSQAAAYCAAAGKRLPEHAEWEWAARGGPKASTYPWGEDAPDAQVCWSGITVQASTCAVGAFPAGDNPWGVHDLAGNLQEWTATKWVPSADPLQITKGGTWAANTGVPLAAKNVNADPPLNRHNALGFRCAKSL